MQSCFLLKKKKRTKENKSDTEDTDVKGGMNVRIQRQLKNEIKEKRSTRISTRVKQKKKRKIFCDIQNGVKPMSEEDGQKFVGISVNGGLIQRCGL